MASLLVKGKLASLKVFIFKSVTCSSFTQERILTVNACIWKLFSIIILNN